MDDLQPQSLFEDVEVPIAMQQRVIVPDAIGGDDEVNGLAHGMPVVSEPSVVPGRIDCELAVVQFDQLELHDIGRDRRRDALIGQAHQYFSQHE